MLSRSDIKGAFEGLQPPTFDFAWTYEPLWMTLPPDVLTSTAARVQHHLSSAYGIDNAVTDTFVSMHHMSLLTRLATSNGAMRDLNSLRLIESHFYLIDRLIISPELIQKPESVSRRLDSYDTPGRTSSGPRDETLTCSESVEQALRLAGLFYIKVAKGGSREVWDELVDHLWLLNLHSRNILNGLQRSMMDDVHNDRERLLKLKGPLIWICAIGQRAVNASELEGWNWRTRTPDTTVYRELLQEIIGFDTADIDTLPEEDLEFGYMYDIGIMNKFRWDLRADLREILAGDIIDPMS